MVIIRSLVYFATFYIVTALYLVLGSWLLFGPRRWAMKGLELHGRTCVALLRIICGTKLEVRGRENLPKTGCLVVSKHQSAWDSFGLVPLFRDPAIVLKDELKWIPFYGWFCVKFEHILVKREKASAALEDDDPRREAAHQHRSRGRHLSGRDAHRSGRAAGLQIRLCGTLRGPRRCERCRWP